VLRDGYTSLACFTQVSITRPTTGVGAADYFDRSPAHPTGIQRKGPKLRDQNMRETPMSAMPSPAQSDLYVGLLPVEPLAEPPPVRPTTLENEGSQNEQPSLHKRARRAIARFLIIFCIGVATTFAWQSYGDEAREMIANSYPRLGWLAPQAKPVAQNAPETIALVAPAAPSFDQQLIAISFDLDAVRQDIDKIAASIAAIQEQMSHSTDRIATERIARSVAQLMAGQEQMTREITKLQAVEQYVLYKNSEPPLRPAPAPARNPVPRPSQAPMVR
jgi:hypothetical protein